LLAKQKKSIANLHRISQAQNLHDAGVAEYFIDTFLGFIIFFSEYSLVFCGFCIFIFPTANSGTRWVVRSCPAREEEEPPGARSHGSRREFTHQWVYKRA
jgi:hypothetical protein